MNNGEIWRTMLQKSTASPLAGFTHNPWTIFPPQLHSPDPACRPKHLASSVKDKQQYNAWITWPCLHISLQNTEITILLQLRIYISIMLDSLVNKAQAYILGKNAPVFFFQEVATVFDYWKYVCLKILVDFRQQKFYTWDRFNLTF